MRLVAFILLAGMLLMAADANKLARQAAQAAREGDFVRAHLLYAEAAQLARYSTFASQSQAMLNAAVRHDQVTMPGLSRVALVPAGIADGVAGQQDGQEEDTELAGAELSDEITEEDLQETRQPLPPLRLKADAMRTAIARRAPAKNLWRDILRTYGLDVVFDEALRDGPPLSLELDNASYRDAIRALELATNSLAYPVTESLLLIAPNDQNTQSRLEPNAAIAIPIPTTIQTEDAQEIANALRQALEIKALMVDGSRRLMLVRDRYARLVLAQALAAELMNAPRDIILEVELREVNRRSLHRYGINWPTSFPVILLTNWLNNTIRPTTGLGYVAFGGNPMVAIGVGATEAVAFMSSNQARTIYRAEIRSSSGRELQLNVGQRFPVVQQGFLTAPTNQAGSSTFFPQVDFRQLGFELKATPIAWREQITLDLRVSVELLSGESVNGIPILSNREANTRVRLEAGQTIALAGLMNREEAVNLSGLAGLSRLPGIGALFRQTTTQSAETELLILVTPRLVHPTRLRRSSPALYSGTATRFLAPL